MELELRDRSHQEPARDRSKLCKNLYFLNNYDEYSFKFRLSSNERRKLNFNINILVEIMDGKKFETVGLFVAEPGKQSTLYP